MSGFKRWVSYIYSYSGEIKGKNVGFAKIDARDGRCRLSISIRGVYGCDERGLEIGFYIRSADGPVRVPAARMRILRGNGDFCEVTPEEDLFATGLRLCDCGGLWLTGALEGTFYLTSWEKGCLDIREFLRAPNTASVTVTAASLESSVRENENGGGTKTVDNVGCDTGGEPCCGNNTEEAAVSSEAVSLSPEAQTALPAGAQTTPGGAAQTASASAFREPLCGMRPGRTCQMNRRTMPTASLEDLPEPDLWESLCRYYPKTAPELADEGTELLQIRPADIRYLPRRLWHFGSNSFLLHGYYRYRHLVLGRMKQGEQTAYILGVRGIHEDREQFSAGLFGFDHFLPVGDNGEGYWYTQITLGAEK